MFLDLSRIRTAHEHVDNVYPADAFRPDELYTVVEPVKLSFDIFKDKEQFRLAGRVTTALELTCSRCLEPFRWPVDEPFELTYYPQSQNAGEGERQIEDADFSTAYYEHDQIDLEQLVRERFLISIPMKPLCAEECRGLCPSCGTNLNKGTCDCKAGWEDPRLAVLKTLKKDAN